MENNLISLGYALIVFEIIIMAYYSAIRCVKKINCSKTDWVMASGGGGCSVSVLYGVATGGAGGGSCAVYPKPKDTFAKLQSQPDAYDCL